MESEVGLSPREVEVLQLAALGHSYGEIAHALVISRHTVDRYLIRVRRKLGARNTTHAAALALTAGILDDSILRDQMARRFGT